MISLDLETHPIAPCLQAPPPVCVALAWAGGRTLRLDVVDLARALLASETPIVGHGIAFDMACIGAADESLIPAIFAAYDANRIHDTMIRAKLLDIANGCYRGWHDNAEGKKEKYSYSLEALTRRYFGHALDKSTYRLTYHKLDGVPLEQWPQGAIDYALDDADWTLRLFDLQAQEDPDLFVDQYRQGISAFWLRLMSCWGLITDPQRVREFEAAKLAEYHAAGAELAVAGLVSWVPKTGKWKRNTKVAGARLATAFAGRECPRTPTGAPALDEASCIKSGDPMLVRYAELASLQKTLSTDVPLLMSGSVTPIHARFEELQETGRTGSSPNLQNLPKDGGIRECFVPRPGHLFASADFSSLELRTVAQVIVSRFGKSKLADALNTGADPHLEMAARILNIPYAEAERRKKEPEVKNARQVGKVANFGFPGGLGATRFVHFAALSYKVTLTEHQARKLKDTWLSQWPEFQDYFRWIGIEVEQDFPRIRQLFSGRWRGGVSYTEACNTLFQGLGADAAKASGWALTKQCFGIDPGPLFGSRIVNFIHDEFIVEVPEERGHECAHEVARLMRDAAQPWTPDVEMSVSEPVLMRQWSKDAGQVWDGGRLVPWVIS